MKYAVNDKGYYMGPVEDNYSGEYTPIDIEYPVDDTGYYLWDFDKAEWVFCYPVDQSGNQLRDILHLNEAFYAPTIDPITPDAIWDWRENAWVAEYDPVFYDFDAITEETWVDGVKIRDSFSLLNLTNENKQFIRDAYAANPQFFTEHDIKGLCVFGYNTNKNHFTAYDVTPNIPEIEAAAADLGALYNKTFSFDLFVGHKIHLDDGSSYRKYFDKNSSNYSNYELPPASVFNYGGVYDDPNEGFGKLEIYFNNPETAGLIAWVTSKGLSYVDSFDLDQYQSTQYSIVFNTTTGDPISFKQYRRGRFWTMRDIENTVITMTGTLKTDAQSRLALAEEFLSTL